MDVVQAKQVLDHLSYKDWEFVLIQEGNSELFLQVQFVEQCTYRSTARPMRQLCRKWRISPRSTTSEVVQTAFAAILMAEEHEARERFRYKGRAIFSPHFDVEALVELYDSRRKDMRPNSLNTTTPR